MGQRLTMQTLSLHPSLVANSSSGAQKVAAQHFGKEGRLQPLKWDKHVQCCYWNRLSNSSHCIFETYIMRPCLSVIFSKLYLKICMTETEKQFWFMTLLKICSLQMLWDENEFQAIMFLTLFCLIDIITTQKLIVLHIQFLYYLLYYHIHNNLKGVCLHNAANCQMLTSQTLSSCFILEKPVCV